ncbi:MAG TPA: hypothetical protein QF353_05270 [Gammaproteobacteria bacterium]|nr:hypothetical protein [Gammaproteobacteria bacterium]
MKARRGLQDNMPKVSEILHKSFGNLVLGQDKLAEYQSKLNEVLGENLKNQIKVVAVIDGKLKLISQTSSASFWFKLNKLTLEKKLNIKLL